MYYLCLLVFSFVKCFRASHAVYLSTNMPAWTAWTMLRKRGFSSFRRSIRPICLVKVEASQSRTSEGTDSDCMSLSSSSVSTSRLRQRTDRSTQNKQQRKNEIDAKTKGLMKYFSGDETQILDLSIQNITSYIKSKHLVNAIMPNTNPADWHNALWLFWHV